MSAEGRSLLDFRLVIVTGKGGTGKTTVAACVAEAARRAGQRVLLAETATIESIAGLFEPSPAPLGYTGRELRPGLHAMRIDPHEALADYLGLQIGLRALTERVLKTETFGQLLEAAPGWRELIILGKIWHLESQRDEAGRPEWDLIVVDAPATGHGLTFLDVPRVVQQAVRAGPLTRHAGWVEALVHDRDRTLLLPVTLPEDLPVQETRDLVERARSELDVGVDRVVVNAMPRIGRKTYAAALEALAPELRPATLPDFDPIVEMLGHAEKRATLAGKERIRVAELCGLPVVDLPFAPAALDLGGDWSALAEAVLASPCWPDADSESEALDARDGASQ